MRPCRARARMHVNLQKNSSMTVQLRHACGCDARMFEQKKRLLMIYFGLKGRVELQQYYCWYIFYSWIRRKFFSWYIPNSKQVLISEFEAKFIGHFRNENTTFTKIWKLGVSAFLYESFWIIVLLMQRKSHAKKLSIPSRIGTARLDGK